MGVDFANQAVVSEYARTTIRVKAKTVVRQPGLSRSDLEDVEQELVVHLLSKAQQFDPNRGSLNTFISRVVDSGVAMLVRDRERAKRNPAGDAEVQSLADAVSRPNASPQPLANLISQHDLERRTGGAALTDAEAFELADDVASVLPSLPPRLQDVCRSLLTRKRSETAAELGLSRHGLRTASGPFGGGPGTARFRVYCTGLEGETMHFCFDTCLDLPPCGVVDEALSCRDFPWEYYGVPMGACDPNCYDSFYITISESSTSPY